MTPVREQVRLLRRARRLRAVAQGERRPRNRGVEWRTRALGLLAGATVVVLFIADFVRVRRLGTLPLSRGDKLEPTGSLRQQVKILREGYAVSSTRENAIFNMVASFIVTFGITRGITISIRKWGGFGPIRNIQTSSGRHIHHFLPGMIVAFLSGGLSIASRREEMGRWLALPFGTGVALVADESALLLELEDVYWSEEGVLSVRVAFAAIALLAALAYAIEILARGKPSLEVDWEQAAHAFDDLQLLRGGTSGERN